MSHRLLGEILLEQGAVSVAALEEALSRQQRQGGLLGSLLLELGACSEEELLAALGEQLSLPLLRRLVDTSIEPDAVRQVPAQLALRHQVQPLSLSAGRLRVAVADPFNYPAFEDVAFVTRLRVEPVLAPAAEVRRLTERFYMQQALREEAGDEEIELLRDDDGEGGDLQQLARDTVVIQWVNMLLRRAVEDRASDVHLEPFEHGLRVRYRVDGVLHEEAPPPRRLQSAIISRVKIMASLDIAERRLPQDGRIKLRISGKEVDLRVSTMPTLFGETVVLRVLERSASLLDLGGLGMLPEDRVRFEGLLQTPHGILLVTGPTGSGKTTTLYSALRETASNEKKVITTEDPIEYQLEGVNQIQVRPKIGLSFANALRHILRQDPDVIMVGEIRDAETAEIAIHAALTGHLVFSTLHTNDSAGTVIRLLEMGIEPFLVASSLEAVLAQRLVRKLCVHCAVPDESFAPLPEGIVERRMRPVGCEECRFTGYRGRLGIFELLVMNEELRGLVVQRATAAELLQAASAGGMQTLLADGLRKVAMGVTSLEEVVRVTRRDEGAS